MVTFYGIKVHRPLTNKEIEDLRIGGINECYYRVQVLLLTNLQAPDLRSNTMTISFLCAPVYTDLLQLNLLLDVRCIHLVDPIFSVPVLTELV